MKKIIFVVILLVVGLTFFFAKGGSNQDTNNQILGQEVIRVAACPTCFKIYQKIDSQKYEIIKTASTAESLSLLENNQVDLILSGRKLKPTEPQMDYLPVGNGYSFLAKQELVVYYDKLKDFDIYTDLNLEEIGNTFSNLSLNQVDNVYHYLDKGIVITSWQNTDYGKANMVHLLESDGERVRLSRRPTIYCPETCSKKAEELASSLVE